MYTYSRYKTVVSGTLVSGFISVVCVEEYFVHWSKKLDARLQFCFRIISLCFRRNKGDEFTFWCYIVSIGAAEQVPATN